jgi:hypothetical protein
LTIKDTIARIVPPMEAKMLRNIIKDNAKFHSDNEWLSSSLRRICEKARKQIKLATNKTSERIIWYIPHT